LENVKRVYVEKREGFDVGRKHLLGDLKEQLHIGELSDIRILVRYDVQGLSDAQFDLAVKNVFSEPPMDRVFIEELPEFSGGFFAVEYLPGQYDQRADSAAQCIEFLTQSVRPEIKCATVYILNEGLSEAQIDAIKSYIINPVDSHEAQLKKYQSLDMETHMPPDVMLMEGFIEKSDEDTENLVGELGLAMSCDDIKFVRDYFASQKRNPTITEIRVIDTYWSDHCRHTTFLTQLGKIEIEDVPALERAKKALADYHESREFVYGKLAAQKPVSLMDIATMGVRLLKRKGLIPDLDDSEEVNACSIKIDVDVDGETQPYLLMFKNETHNHPTEIEPFGGAATCLGGAIRDPLSGRSYVYQAMRVTGCADPRADVKDTIKGKLPQRTIATVAAKGYSSYGNQIGLATGQVSEIYDKGFMAKHMEIGAVIAAAPAENVIRERPQEDDIIVLLGGRTGRDGCGGATGSSKAHDVESIDTCGAEVQKGNPPTERKIQRLFRNAQAAKMIIRCNDFGAGGVCVAIGELADSLDIDLDLVRKKYEGLDGTELAISESQERMAVVLKPENVERFIKLAEDENLEAYAVAKVTDTGRLRMKWRGKEILNIERSFLDTNGMPQYSDAKIAAPDESISPFKASPSALSPKESWLDAVSGINACSQRGLSEMFDSTIGAGTVIMPFGGAYQTTPTQAMAAKIPVLGGETTTCSVMAYGYEPAISRYSPFHGGVYAVVESLLRMACAGADVSGARLTFQEYFERLRSDVTRWGKPAAALLGAFEAQNALGIPSIGGKDSMSGSFEDMDVPPVLCSFAVTTADSGDIISAEFKREDSILAVVNLAVDDNNLPDYEAFMCMCQAISKGIRKGKILAAHTLCTGGLAAAVAKMSVGNKIGAEIFIGEDEIFKPRWSGAVVEVANGAALDQVLCGLDYDILGMTNASGCITFCDVTLPVGDMAEAVQSPLEKVYPIKEKASADAIKSAVYSGGAKKKAGVSIAKPKVFIPVFPGTNTEYDTARAFEKAGGAADVLVIKNLLPEHVEETLAAMKKMIDDAQILMLPGGFSAGDEPEGSAKFIAAALRAPQIKDAVTNLLNNRDGLVLGICNGFQALIKTGLVPYGEIREAKSDSPTLTFNNIGRHQSRIVRTKAVSNLSPWMAGVTPGDVINVAISHGEGRFVCTEDEFDALLKNGQIAWQYVNIDGNPTYDIDYNPNGSLHAVEGITSPDGRVLGKMGHNERWSQNTFRNVPGEYDSGIFKAGVNYFK
jgi:phosphoribosylformylglycinamidine synthase